MDVSDLADSGPLDSGLCEALSQAELDPGADARILAVIAGLSDEEVSGRALEDLPDRDFPWLWIGGFVFACGLVLALTLAQEPPRRASPARVEGPLELRRRDSEDLDRPSYKDKRPMSPSRSSRSNIFAD